MEGTFVNRPNVKLIYETLARILGEQHNARITVTVRPRTQEERRSETFYVGEAEEKTPTAV